MAMTHNSEGVGHTELENRGAEEEEVGLEAPPPRRLKYL